MFMLDGTILTSEILGLTNQLITVISLRDLSQELAE